MDLTYVHAYEHLYRHHWWWRARETYVLRWIRRLVPPGGWDGVLDVGCGNGLLFTALRPFGPAFGVEPDGSIVSPALRERIHVGPFDATFQPGRTFGLILMLDVLEHVDDPAGMLRRARELLAPGGLVLLTVPAHPWLWTAHDDLNDHRRRYTRGALRAVVQRAGLSLATVRHFFHWLVAAKLMVRGWEALAGRRPRPPRIPPRPLNVVLDAVSRAEQRLLTPLRPPVGASLLAVVR